MRVPVSVAATLFVLLVPFSSLRAQTLQDDLFERFEGDTITAITYTGNRTTKESLILRETKLRAGDVFSYAQLQIDYAHLENLSIFGTIRVLPSEYQGGVSLEYDFREMPSYIPYIAFRYTEQNGFSVGPALSAVNLYGRAIRVSGRLLVGGTNTFILSMTYPWIFPNNPNRITLVLDANYLIRDDELNLFEEQSVELTPWWERWIGENGRFAVMGGFFQMHSDIDSITIDTDNTDNMLRLATSIGWDGRDSWRSPHSGWEMETELWYTYGDPNYFTSILDVRKFTPTFGENQTLVTTGLLQLNSGQVGTEFPSYFRYFLGGANSVRGQDWDLGLTANGKNEFIFTGEYWWNVLPLRSYNFFRWSALIGVQLAGFVDSGIAWNQSDEFNTDNFYSGFGLGMRLLIPGSEMTRFDVGFNRQGDVYFHFATWFKWTAQRFRLR